MDLLGIITAAVAVLPTVVIMFVVLFNSDGSKKPFRKTASVFAVSALSVIPAAIAEAIGEVILLLGVEITGLDTVFLSDDSTFAAALYYAIQYFFIVGVAEELCKYFTFKWIIFHDREFDNTYDGVIYGAASALGFATLENLMYVFLVSESALETAVLRALLSVPMHAVTGIVMGYYFGISKYRKYNNVQTSSRPENKALLFSIILHGAYDTWVTMPEIFTEMSDALSYGVLAVLMIFIYITLGRTIVKAKKQRHRIYNAYYYQQLDGRIQDMIGGQTSDKKRFFGFPLPMTAAWNGGAVQQPQPQFTQGVPQYSAPPFVQGATPYAPPQFTSAPPPIYPNQAQFQQQQYQQTQRPQPQYDPCRQNYRQPAQNPSGVTYPQQNVGYQNQNAYQNQYQNARPYSQPCQPYQQQYQNPQLSAQSAAAVPRKRRFCSNCGEPTEANNNFCRVCGNALKS